MVECVVVDPGGFEKDMKRLLKRMKKLSLKLQYVLITHGHLDHILGVRRARMACFLP